MENATAVATAPAQNNSPAAPEKTKAVAKSGSPMQFGGGGIIISSFDALWNFAHVIEDSGMAPKGMNRQAIAVAIQMGLEVGLSPMQALQSTAVINGRPGIFGDAALALVRASGLMARYGERFGFWCDDCQTPMEKVDADGNRTTGNCPVCNAKPTPEHRGCIVTSERNREEPMTSGFNIRMAKTASLWGKQGPWSQYPDRMLKFRARGFNLRDNFGDVLKGLKTTEELHDEVIDAPAPAQLPPPGRSSLKSAPPTVEAPRPETKPMPTAETQPETATQPTKVEGELSEFDLKIEALGFPLEGSEETWRIMSDAVNRKIEDTDQLTDEEKALVLKVFESRSQSLKQNADSPPEPTARRRGKGQSEMFENPAK